MLTLTIICARLLVLLLSFISIYHCYIIQRYVSVDNRTRILTKIVLVFPVNENLNYISKIGQCFRLLQYVVQSACRCHAIFSMESFIQMYVFSSNKRCHYSSFQLFHGYSILVSTSRRDHLSIERQWYRS